MPKVFALEDDDNIRELVCYALQAAGFEAVGFDNAQSFWRVMRAETPDIILLDIMLPDEDGIAILQALKRDSRTHLLPVIMLTAKSMEYDRIKGLDLGADDYIAKPFSVLELVSRIRAVLRRTGETSRHEAVIHVGGISLDADRRWVRVDGSDVTLTYKEFELLHLLMQYKDIALSREKILAQVWGYEYEGYSNRTVDMHIKTLRQKLGAGGDMIKTIRSLGYKLDSGADIK